MFIHSASRTCSTEMVRVKSNSGSWAGRGGKRLRANKSRSWQGGSSESFLHSPSAHVTARETISAESACWTEMEVLSMDDHLCYRPWYANYRIDFPVQSLSPLDFECRNCRGLNSLFNYYPCHAISTREAWVHQRFVAHRMASFLLCASYLFCYSEMKYLDQFRPSPLA